MSFCRLMPMLMVVIAMGVLYLSPEEWRDDWLSKSKVFYDNLLSTLGQSPGAGEPAGTDGPLISEETLRSNKFKYLAIVGEVFDVSSGARHYGEGEHYSFFTGVDGTRAYSSGDFSEAGLIPDVTGLPPSQLKAIDDFRLMYHKQYKYVGKLVGHYYTATGEGTEHKVAYTAALGLADQEKAAKKAELEIFPPCNSEFKSTGSRVWCSDRSGGIVRGWDGLPRRLYKPDSFRCACVRTTGPPSSDLGSTTHDDRGDLDNPKLRPYDNCALDSISCPI